MSLHNKNYCHFGNYKMSIASALFKMGNTQNDMACLSLFWVLFRECGQRAVSSHQRRISAAVCSDQLLSPRDRKERVRSKHKFLPAAFPGRDLERFITTHDWLGSVSTLYSSSENCIQKREMCFLQIKIHFAVSNPRPCPCCAEI